jgi:hypothetical protein
MNAKEQIIDILKYIKETNTYIKEPTNNDLNHLITAIEAAIFDLPSEEEIEKQIINQYDYWVIGFKDGINFILNYKKPEPDGK